jgi:hypothetical protein
MASEFLFSLLLFSVDSMEKFQTNPDIHSLNTRHKSDLHMLNASLTSYQKNAYYAGINLFSTLPSNIESLSYESYKRSFTSLLLLCRKIYVNWNFWIF